MNHTVFGVVLFSFIFLPSVSAICENGWEQRGLYCYYFSTDNVTYEEAKLRCSEDYADVVAIDDSQESIFLWENGPNKGRESFWIGYKRVLGTIWRWEATGKAGAFSDWDIGEPDDEGDCARMTPFSYGAWRDFPCEEPLNFICKKFADCGYPDTMSEATVVINPDPEAINGSVFPMDTEATYTCIEGYEFADESISKSNYCSLGGAWIPELVGSDECQPRQCPPPPIFENSVTNGSVTDTEFGSIVTYDCIPGYWFNKLDENVTKFLMCDFDKVWRDAGELKYSMGDYTWFPSMENGNISDCEKVHCVRPITNNARADTPLNQLGTVAKYECDPGFKYSDNDTIKTFRCGEFGWIPSVMECQERKCPDHDVTGAIPSTTSTTVFTTVTWTCEKGKRYSDTTTRKSMYCREDEKWDKRVTQSCQKKICEFAPPNDTTTYESDYDPIHTYRFEDFLNYTCRANLTGWFFSDGLTYRIVTCTANGIWAPAVITDCISGIISVPIGVTYPDSTPASAEAVGSIALVMIFVVLGLIVVFDLCTIGKHIEVLKENLCPPKPEGEVEEVKGEAPPTQAVQEV